MSLDSLKVPKELRAVPFLIANWSYLFLNTRTPKLNSNALKIWSQWTCDQHLSLNLLFLCQQSVAMRCSITRNSAVADTPEYQLRLGRQRQVWLIPIADERVGVQIKP